MNPKCIVMIAPDVFSAAGGIQRYTQTMILAIRESYPDSKLVVLSKHDRKRKRDGVVFHGFNLKTAMFGSLRFVVGCLKKLFLYSPDLIITTHVNYTPIARIYHQSTGTPYVTACHGVEVWKKLSTFRQWGLDRAAQKWSVSSFTSEKMIKAKLAKSSTIQFFPNCMNSDDFEEAPKPESLLQKYELKSEMPILLTVNRFEKKESFKAYEAMLSALPKIQKHVPDFRWIVVGAGNDWARFSRKVFQKKMSNHVILTGYVEEDELPLYYQLADLFILPSMLEGFGIVYLEAMACGTFCIGSARDGSRQALRGGKLGRLVDPQNSREIAHAVIEHFTQKEKHPLAYDPKGLRRAMMKTYGFAPYCERLKALIHEILND